MITFQYFDGCPSTQATLHNLLEVMEELGIPEARLQLVEVPGPAQAEEHRFQGSPTILVNGRDIATGEVPEGFNFTCRIYSFGGEATGVVPRELIRERLAEWDELPPPSTGQQ